MDHGWASPVGQKSWGKMDPKADRKGAGCDPEVVESVPCGPRKVAESRPESAGTRFPGGEPAVTRALPFGFRRVTFGSPFVLSEGIGEFTLGHEGGWGRGAEGRGRLTFGMTFGLLSHHFRSPCWRIVRGGKEHSGHSWGPAGQQGRPCPILRPGGRGMGLCGCFGVGNGCRGWGGPAVAVVRRGEPRQRWA